MERLIWMYDIAREQAPSPAQLIDTCRLAADAGYDTIGLYLEHRFAYPSTPWAHQPDILQPATVQELKQALGQTRVMPFLNVLGHCEGFVRSRGGAHLAEGDARYSASICPSHPSAQNFARMLIADALDVFDDEWVHIGGDETWQLGQCPLCSVRVDRIGKAGLYAEHYAPLCKWLIERGKRPCLWGDMLLQHPEALESLPRETVLFDWQYDNGPRETSQTFRSAGFDVICCPAVKSYHAPWCFVDQTQSVIDEHRAAVPDLEALGVCVTTWESVGLCDYASLMPIICAAVARLRDGADWDVALRGFADDAYCSVAQLLGVKIPNASPTAREVGPKRFRSRFLLGLDPLQLWRCWRGELRGSIGAEIVATLEQVNEQLPQDHILRRPWLCLDVAVRFCQHVEEAYQQYPTNPPGARDEMRAAEAQIARLAPLAEEIAREGGSRVDPARVQHCRDWLQVVIERFPVDVALSGYQPAFEQLLRHDYVEGDQAGWGFAGPEPE